MDVRDECSYVPWIQFSPGSGYLKYYIDNWRTAQLAGFESVGDVPAGKGIGVVML